MKKWIKNWWFSITMWLFATAILVYVIIGLYEFDEEILLNNLILFSSFTPILIIYLIGVGNMPKKEKKDE